MPSFEHAITTYEYSGLKGRKLYVPARVKTNKVILLVYGQHVSIERLLPMASFLSNYGAVYLVDNPGFGNMQPSYQIGSVPSLEFYDGHLKHVFDTVLPKQGQLTIVGISFGFQLITHFLQSYPQYQKRTAEVVSFVGFVRHANLHLPKEYGWLFKYILAYMGRTWLGGMLLRYIFFQPVLIAPLHVLISPLNAKLRGTSLKTRWNYSKEQAWLWKYNDPRTHAYTAWQFLTSTDLTNQPIALLTHHAYAKNDQYFDNKQVIADLKRIYRQVKAHPINLPAHSPIDLEDEYSIAEFVPEEILKILQS